MGLLGQLRDQGLQFTAEGDRLNVQPRAALTDALRTTIRINKPAILRALKVEWEAHRKALQITRDAAPLEEYRAGLTLGRLHLCGNCSAFTFASDPASMGQCSRFGDAWPFVPFYCAAFQASPTPAAPAYLPQPHRKKL
jgi:hypothetical protein